MQKPEVKTAKKTEKSNFGCTASKDKAVFRFFCPRARRVTLEIFEKYKDPVGDVFVMDKNNDGVWSLTLKGNYIGKLYGYHIFPPQDADDDFMITDELVADPYSHYVVSKNHFKQFAKTLIIEDDDFDWEDDTFVNPSDPRDLIIYEAHLKDMTAHPNNSARNKGTYKGFVDPRQKGGLNHIKQLGVNAVEFLPLQNFAAFEPPYLTATGEQILNTWNYYGRNHWGYMTSFFFAPESIYASDSTVKRNEIVGEKPTAINEFKDVVKSLHSNGISVIMDVVYNHVSNYDINPLKYADKKYYFRLDEDNNFISDSGCGNDFKSESPLARQLIVDSICYWMEEYHIDGFRFDLGLLIDWETFEAIRDAARQINPDVILIAEPWHLKGYDPTGFSERDISAWNDKFRNGVKGSNPHTSTGFIFGDWHPGVSREDLQNFIMGTLLHGPNPNPNVNGSFWDSKHSVNYLESHDNLTLGDFIRITQKPEREDKVYSSKEEVTPLDEEAMKYAKLAALYLLSSQGITMIHEGQEWARSKIIAVSPINDPRTGCIDHNSYEKDNATNYLDFEEIEWNQELYDYYKGLIALRQVSPALRRSNPDQISFIDMEDPLHITYYVNGESTSDNYDYFISLNGNKFQEQTLQLPEGYWELVVSNETASHKTLSKMSGSIVIEPTSGVILRKLRN
ncbi:MAG TPA: hypothetical protein VKA34_01615 [Balneolales bacterium]|nr:hypothetical protein [Balneolales bacterium]